MKIHHKNIVLGILVRNVSPRPFEKLLKMIDLHLLLLLLIMRRQCWARLYKASV